MTKTVPASSSRGTRDKCSRYTDLAFLLNRPIGPRRIPRLVCHVSPIDNHHQLILHFVVSLAFHARLGIDGRDVALGFEKGHIDID